jgi:hypothetical protein
MPPLDHLQITTMNVVRLFCIVWIVLLHNPSVCIILCHVHKGIHQIFVLYRRQVLGPIAYHRVLKLSLKYHLFALVKLVYETCFLLLLYAHRP